MPAGPRRRQAGTCGQLWSSSRWLPLTEGPYHLPWLRGTLCHTGVPKEQKPCKCFSAGEPVVVLSAPIQNEPRGTCLTFGDTRLQGFRP